MSTLEQSRFDQLAYAKRSVTWLLEHANGSVDFKGIVYWAGRVEELREVIKESL